MTKKWYTVASERKFGNMRYKAWVTDDFEALNKSREIGTPEALEQVKKH